MLSNNLPIKVDSLVRAVTNSIEVAKQLIEDISEKNRKATILEELLTHLIEFLKCQGVLIHVIVARLEELVEVAMDLLFLSTVHVDKALVVVVLLSSLLLLFIHLCVQLFLLEALASSLSLLSIAAPIGSLLHCICLSLQAGFFTLPDFCADVVKERMRPSFLALL